MHLPILAPRRGAAFLLLAALATDAIAQTTVVVPCAADNTLYQDVTGSLSNGSGIGLFVGLTGTGGIRRAVLRFNVGAALPPNAVVISATLSMNVAQSTVFLPMNVTAHRVLASWGEGTSIASGNGGGGGPAAANDATWLHRFYPGTPWATVGGDFAAVPSFVLSMPGFGPFSSTPSAAMAADVQSWLSNPALNFGWLLKTDELLASTAHRIDSRESPGPKPTLSVTYLVPGQNGAYGTGCPIGAGNFGAAWVGAPTGGNTVQINKTNAQPGSVGADYFALAVDPLGLPLQPGCTVYLPLLQIIPGGIFLTNPGGNGSNSFVIPNGFPGYLIACQSAVLDLSPLGFSVSNAALTVLQ
ncbi:MAG: DNRLRE domain-containing protein [Planctomycetota bacterium]